MSSNCLFRNIFSPRAIFVRSLHIFLNPISKMFCNFLLQLNMEKRRHAFLALFVLKPREKINWRKTKFALTCSLQKVIRTLAFSGREKIGNSFFFKIFSMV